MRSPAPPARGVLRSGRAGVHRRLLPCAELSHCIEHFWWVEWNVAAPVVVETLPHPSVHLVFEAPSGSAELSGVHRARFTKTLEGRGRAFGVKFRPAMFQPWLGGSLSRLSDTVVPVRSVFGTAGAALGRALRSVTSLERAISLTEPFLLARLPPRASTAESMRDLVEAMAKTRELVRVEDVSSRAGLDVRTLQRRFRFFVGASPKWVLQRYRLHEAAEALKQPNPPALAELSAALGYFDQAHFAREFKAVIGQPPGEFVLSQAQRQTRTVNSRRRE